MRSGNVLITRVPTTNGLENDLFVNETVSGLARTSGNTHDSVLSTRRLKPSDNRNRDIMAAPRLRLLSLMLGLENVSGYLKGCKTIFASVHSEQAIVGIQMHAFLLARYPGSPI